MKFSKIQLFSILLIPLIYLLLQSTLLDLKGPSWILMPQDLGYNYLFNGLNFLNFSQIGTLIHPALIQIIFHGVLSLIIFTINGTGNFVENVIIYAENY